MKGKNIWIGLNRKHIEFNVIIDDITGDKVYRILRRILDYKDWIRKEFAGVVDPQNSIP